MSDFAESEECETCFENVSVSHETPEFSEQISWEEDFTEVAASPFVWDFFEPLPLPDASALPDMDEIVHIHKLFCLEDVNKQELLSEYASVEHITEVQKTAERSSEGQKRPLQELGEVRVAIVVDDMGASPMRTDAITALRAPLTASFVTFAPQLKRQVAQSRQAGHEVMIHVPMQPHASIYVSDDVLTVDMSEEQIKNGFMKMLKKFDGVKGINNHMGSLFTERADKLAAVMEVLSEKQMFFLDSKTTSRSAVEKVAQAYHVPCVHRHVFLDNENDLDYILKQLAQTEQIARKNGYAIAIGHPKTQTAKALKIWLDTLEDKGISLVPLSEIVALN